MRTGTAPDIVFSPNWFAYNKMDNMFLRDVYEKRTTINTDVCISFKNKHFISVFY